MNPKIKNHKAFSLIEMSLVILVIGAMVASIMGSTVIIDKYRLYLARSLTESSPVSITKNLKVWYDSTTKKSFLDTETGNALRISTWNDRNTLSNARNNATQGTDANRPTYRTNCVNGLPCVRFDGNDLLSFDGTFLARTDYTVIIVEQRRDNTDNYFFGSSTDAGTNINLHLGYRTSTVATFAQYSNDFDYTIDAYTAPMAKIHTYRYSSINGKTYHINGALQTASGGGGTATTGLTSFNNASIGSTIGNYYNGDICEVIIFDREITSDERSNIEKYLGQKWKITVS